MFELCACCVFLHSSVQLGTVSRFHLFLTKKITHKQMVYSCFTHTVLEQICGGFFVLKKAVAELRV